MDNYDDLVCLAFAVNVAWVGLPNSGLLFGQRCC